MTSALSILERVYRQARGQLKARPGSGVFTVDVKELADHLGKAQVAADLGFRLEAVGPNAQLRMASSGGRAG